MQLNLDFFSQLIALYKYSGFSAFYLSCVTSHEIKLLSYKSFKNRVLPSDGTQNLGKYSLNERHSYGRSDCEDKATVIKNGL